MGVKFYRCNHCGNIVLMVHDAGVNPVCCGEKMELLVPNEAIADIETHTPAIEPIRDGHALKVSVGSPLHEQGEDHAIQWIALVTEDRSEIHYIGPGAEPTSMFAGAEHGVAYAYCDLHGLWMTEF